MTVDSRSISTPQIKNINLQDKNLSLMLQAMKERIEKYAASFNDVQAQLNAALTRVKTLEDDQRQQEQRSSSVTVRPATLTADVGSTILWPTTTPPLGWFVCDGSAKSRTTYSALFTLIGTTFGVGDGSTTFNIPDFRGRFVQGKDATDAIGDIVGNTDSLIDLTHDHDVNITSGNNSANVVVQSGTGTTVAADPHTHSVTGSTDVANANPATASNVDVDIRPETLAYNFIIKY